MDVKCRYDKLCKNSKMIKNFSDILVVLESLKICQKPNSSCANKIVFV